MLDKINEILQSGSASTAGDRLERLFFDESARAREVYGRVREEAAKQGYSTNDDPETLVNNVVGYDLTELVLCFICGLFVGAVLMMVWGNL